MELSYFNKMRTIHNSLYSEGLTFTEMELKGGISFSESVNVGEELTIGSCVMSTIEFSLFDLNYLLDDITEKEFTWVQSVQTGQNSYKKLAKAARAGVVCINGAVSYVFNSRPPYISIWDTELVYKLSEPETQPSQAVEGAAVVGNTLYCFHSESPYLTAYRINGQGLSQTSAPTLNRFYQEKIREYCKIGYSCNLQGDILKEYRVDLYDQKPVNLIETVFERIQMGLFNAEKPVKSNDTLIKVFCTDRLNLFERYVDSWLSQINYPITIGNLLRGLCGFVGVQAESYTFLNSDFLIKKNFNAKNISGLQVLRWIAEVAACFGKMTSSGKLKLGWYEPLDYTLNQSVYRSITNEEYQVKKIEKLQVRVLENDIGVIVPSDDPNRANTYVIENNPLLYAETDSELRSTVQKIYDAIKNITYYPYSIELPENPLLHAGNIINISTRKGLTFQAYIMNREKKGGIETFSAVGEKERLVQSDAVNQSIQQIRGSIHTVINDVKQLNSTITEYREETVESIDQINENLSSAVAKITVAESEINQLSDQITLRVTQTEYNQNKNATNQAISQMQSQITQNSSQIALRVTKTEYEQNKTAVNKVVSQLESQIEQNAEQISLKVTQTQLNQSVTQLQGQIKVVSDQISLKVSANDVTSLIEQNANSIRLKASTIAWESTHSSMTEDGTLTCENAVIKGWFECSDNKYYLELDQASISGGKNEWITAPSGEQYRPYVGYINFSGSLRDFDDNLVYGLNIKGDSILLNAKILGTKSPNESAYYPGESGTLQVVTNIRSVGTKISWDHINLTFRNGLMVTELP